MRKKIELINFTSLISFYFLIIQISTPNGFEEKFLKWFFYPITFICHVADEFAYLIEANKTNESLSVIRSQYRSQT